MSLNRFPHGADQKGFYQKNFNENSKSWFSTELIRSDSQDKNINYPLCQNEESLLYLVNLGCIEMNPWLSTISHKTFPDQAVIDIDPSLEVPFSTAMELALSIHELLHSIGLRSFPKTSGGKGFHIYIPLKPVHTFEEIRSFLLILFEKSKESFPNLIITQKSLDKRRGKIYLDYLQNSYGQTMVSPYCVRPKPLATVSCPLLWSEVKLSLKSEDFHIRNMLQRLHKVGDVWYEFLSLAQTLKKALRNLEK